VEIQRAEPDDADALTRIAFAAKRHWGYPERWMERWRDDLTIAPGYISENEVHTVVAAREMVGFYALAGTGYALELEHLWVSPEWIGKGVGRALFGHAVERAATLGAETVRIESDPNAEGFYERMGARRVGENFYEFEGGERVLPLLVASVAGRERRGAS
jgi:predicted N-acetyltransferase YhbS